VNGASSARTIARRSRQILGAALAVLALVYWLLFRTDPQRAAVLAVFIAPPLLLVALLLAGRARAAFWAGVAGLVWFSHAVMLAWTQADVRGWAWILIILSIVIVFASSVPGLHARFSRR